jgi:dihydrofolate reductase
MYNINYILATDRSWSLGKNNDLIYLFQKDLKRFKELTSNKTIVMGSNTWLSLPNKLPNRKNVVLSSKSVNDCSKQPDLILNNINDILELSKKEEVWIIGGASLYKEFLSYVNTIYLTLVNSYSDNDVDVKYLENELKKFSLIKNETIYDINKNDKNGYQIFYKTYKKNI